MERVCIYSVKIGTVGVMSGRVVQCSLYTPDHSWSGPMTIEFPSPEGNHSHEFSPCDVFLSPRISVTMAEDGSPEISGEELTRKIRRRVEERLRKSASFFAAVCAATKETL